MDKKSKGERLLFALSRVNRQLIEEALPDSREAKERRVARMLPLAACIVFAIMAGMFLMMYSRANVPAPPIDPAASLDADTSDPEQIDSATEPDTIEPEETTPAPEYEEITLGGAVYRVYSDHAVVLRFTGRDEIVIQSAVNGVPVTKISDDAVDDGIRLLIYCAASSEISAAAREYAIEHELAYIELGDDVMSDDEYPYFYYPDWVTKHNWHLRDTSGDKWLAEDDNARITKLVNDYLAGNTAAYDELLQRVMYRYACASQFYALWSYSAYPFPHKYEFDWGDSDYTSMCDDSRHQLYLIDHYNTEEYGVIEGNECAAYEFAYGYIDTFEEFSDYVYFLYEKDIADELFSGDEVNGVQIYHVYKRGDAIFMHYTGVGHDCFNKNPVYNLTVEKNKLTLTEFFEIWAENEDGEEYFTGEYGTEIYDEHGNMDISGKIVLEYHDGKWQFGKSYKSPHIRNEYDQHYGG